MKLVVLGASLTGLVTAACLADLGHDVICVAANSAQLTALRAFDLAEPEPGLASLVESQCRRGRLSFTTDPGMATPGADAAFLAIDASTGDLTGMFSAARDFAREPGTCRLLAVVTVVPVGTADQIAEIIHAHGRNREVAIVSNPSFIRPGSAITDMMQADRIIIGTAEPQARTLMGRIYRPLYLDNVPLVYTSRRAAEIIRHASDAYLAMKQAFIQELGLVCEDNGGVLRDVARGIDLDRRIGTSLLHDAPASADPGAGENLLALLGAQGLMQARPRTLSTPATPLRRNH